jgi:hypothetical protein
MLLGDAEDAARFLHVLGPPPADQRDSTDISPFGEYFGRQQGHNSRFDNQSIRSVAFVSGGKRFPPPLPSGHLELFSSHDHENAWHLNISASLNPTRFLRHQRLPWLLRPFSQEPPPNLAANLFERSIGTSYEGEFALCRNDQHKGDNWIPNSHSWQYYASEASWPTQLRNCLTICSNALLSDVQRAIEVADTAAPIQLIGHWKYNVRYVETYWEFTSLTPLGVVRGLEPMLKLFSNYVLQKTKYPCAVTREEIDNSWCLRQRPRFLHDRGQIKNQGGCSLIRNFLGRKWNERIAIRLLTERT